MKKITEIKPLVRQEKTKIKLKHNHFFLFQRPNQYYCCCFHKTQKQLLHFYLIILAKLVTKSNIFFGLFSGVLEQKAVEPPVIRS